MQRFRLRTHLLYDSSFKNEDLLTDFLLKKKNNLLMIKLEISQLFLISIIRSDVKWPIGVHGQATEHIIFLISTNFC